MEFSFTSHIERKGTFFLFLGGSIFFLNFFFTPLGAMSNVFELSTWNPCETSPFQHTSGHVQRWIRITDSAKKAIQDESTALVVLRDC